MITTTYTSAAPRRRMFRVLRKLRFLIVRAVAPLLNQHLYRRLMCRLLSDYGVKVSGDPIYISPKAWFDGYDYSLISIGNKAVISHDVKLLTHDFSLARARDALARRTIQPEIPVARPIHVGDNFFVGMNALLLPGTYIGNDCIVGAGSVVRGTFPNGSVIAGNPAQVVGKTYAWGRRKLLDLALPLDPDQV